MSLWDSVVSATKASAQWVGNALKSGRDMGKQVHETGMHWLDMAKGFLRDTKPWVSGVPYLGDAHRAAEGVVDILGGTLEAGRVVTGVLGGYGDYLIDTVI